MQVSFRAEFQGRKAALGTGGFIFRNPPKETVEVTKRGDRWIAKINGKPLSQLEPQATHGSMKDVIETCFEKKLSPWKLFDRESRPLDPDYVNEDPQGNFSLKELTHIGLMGAEARSTQGENYFKTVCGEVAHVSKIRSGRGSRPPDCKLCRVEWDKTKPEDRLP